MRKIFKAGASLIATTALAASAFAGAAAPAQAAPKCQYSLSHYSGVKIGTKGRSALAAECSLANAGYKVTKNANFGSEDMKALLSFKSRYKLGSAKVVDKATWSALLSRGPRPTLTKSSTGGAVLRVQRALVAVGRPVAITGRMDTATINRIKGLQRAKGYRQTGVVKSGEWILLQSGKITRYKILAPSPTVSSSSASGKGAKAVAFAKAQLGDAYVYGASGPNAWDCSGLTAGAWAAAGVRLPHSSQAQFRVGKSVSRSQLKPGDLVFFYSGISHVGIYVGGGNIIHAARPGQPVEYSKISYMPYQGARRPG